MTPQALKQLDSRLANFLQELTEPMGRSERRHWARVYLEGLLLDGERKSVEPMAARIPGADVQALRQFLSQSPWEVAEVQRRLALKVVGTLNEPELWILDETSFPKAGNHSVGVARQYCGALGKIANNTRLSNQQESANSVRHPGHLPLSRISGTCSRFRTIGKVIPGVFFSAGLL